MTVTSKSRTGKVSINEVGDRTNEQFFGEFEAKIFLSHREELARDDMRRRLLGTNPAFASQRQANQADIFSELEVRIVKAPTWWTETDNGIDMIDDNIAAKVYEAVMGLQSQAFADIKKKTDEAKKKLEDQGNKAD